MKQVAILSIAIFTSSFVFAQKTYVPDDNFEQALIDLGYDDVLDDYVTTSKIAGIKELKLINKSISDLTGIEKLTSLVYLEATSNKLSSVNVSKNTLLEIIILNNNELTSLDIAQNTQLKELNVDGNKINTLDVSNNTELTSLRIAENQLTELDITNNNKLIGLALYTNQLTKLDLTKNTILNEIGIGGNQIANLDITKNISLTALRAGWNQLKSLDVSQNIDLVQLDVSENQLTRLDVSKNKKLTSLNLAENKSLFCIQVADVQQAKQNANYSISDWMNFSRDCSILNVPEVYPKIQTAINSATDGDTVLVAAGIYNETINFNGKLISIIGENKNTTIIDGSGLNDQVVKIESGEDTLVVLREFTIANSDLSGVHISGSSFPKLEDLIVRDNAGTGVMAMGRSVILRNVLIKNNQQGFNGAGGGLYLISSSPFSSPPPAIIENAVFANNKGVGGGAMLIRQSKVTLNHVTVINNEVTGGPAYSNMHADNGADLKIINSIVWGNIGNQIGISDVNASSKINISYSNIEGGSSKITTNNNGELIYGNGNIDVDPLFCDTLSYKYYDTSPVVGTGENGVNMGAMGVGCDVPQAFEWVSSALDTINITKTNLTDTYTTQWTESKDVYGDTIKYLLYAKIGAYPAELIYDTTVTTLPLSYQEIVENVFEGMPNDRATVRFSVSATDGIDTVKVTGDDRVLFINRYDYLSTEEGAIPTEFALHENYPNPFNPTTTLRFDLPEVSDVTVTIYNMLGQSVRTFNMNDTPAGYHSIKWNATNDLGDPVGAGVYLYQLQTKDFVKTRKMVLLK